MADHSAAGKACNDPNWKGGIGNSIVIAHRLPNGEIVLAVYAHLAAPSTFREGDIVGAAEQFGMIGSTGTEAYHLHFEIRRQSMAFVKQTTQMLMLTESPGFWPPNWYG